MTASHDIDRLPPVISSVGAHRIDWHRHIGPAIAFSWLRAGWADLRNHAVPSFAYGIAIFVISLALVGSLVRFGLDYLLFPLLAAFLICGPIIAMGLYEKSRRLASGQPIAFRQMVFVKARSGAQVLFVGLLLCLLALLWVRAAVLLYALFYGLLPFPGVDTLARSMLGTVRGQALIVIGSLVGGLFASFALAVSVFGIPMLLDRRVDALTAMGSSMAIVWNNRPVMVVWGAIVAALFALSIATGLVGLIVIFPLLGHATWHAYAAMCPPLPDEEDSADLDAIEAPPERPA